MSTQADLALEFPPSRSTSTSPTIFRTSIPKEESSTTCCSNTTSESVPASMTGDGEPPLPLPSLFFTTYNAEKSCVFVPRFARCSAQVFCDVRPFFLDASTFISSRLLTSPCPFDLTRSSLHRSLFLDHRLRVRSQSHSGDLELAPEARRGGDDGFGLRWTFLVLGGSKTS